MAATHKTFLSGKRIMVKVSSSDILDELDLLESDDIALVEELLDSTIEKGAPLSLKYRPREGRGYFTANRREHTPSVGQKFLSELHASTYTAPVTLGNVAEKSLHDESVKRETIDEGKNAAPKVTAQRNKPFSQPLYGRTHHQLHSLQTRTSSKVKTPGKTKDINVGIQTLSAIVDSLAKNNMPKLRQEQQDDKDLLENHKDTASTSVTQSYALPYPNTNASESSRSKAHIFKQQEVLTNENDGRHNSSIHGMPLQPASAGYSEMPPASSNESRRRSQHSTRHQSHGIQQELVKTHVPNYDSSSPGQYGFVQENSIANGAASGQKKTKNFSNPMYVEHEANGFPLQGLPAVRPISPEGTFQDTFFDTYAASPGSLYVPEAPQIQSNAFSISSIGQGGYRQRFVGNLYSGAESSYGRMFGQPVPNFGLSTHADTGNSGLFPAQQNDPVPGRIYNPSIKQSFDDYSENFYFNSHNLNFATGENEFAGLEGKRQYLSASLSANSDLELPFRGSFHNGQTDHRTNLPGNAFEYNGVGNNDLGLHEISVPFAGSQHGAIQISPNKVGHLSVVQNSQRDSRPYAILPGGNFHPAQTASTKTPPVPDLKYHEQHQQHPQCAAASDMKSHNATYCTEDVNYPRDSVMQSAFLDPLTARRLVPHIPDEQLVFAEPYDTFATDLMEPQESVAGESNKKYDGPDKTSEDKDSAAKSELRKACRSQVATIRPLRAQNTQNQWKVIVNVDTPRNGQKYEQLVRIETCRWPSMSCSHVSSSVQKSVCSQELTTHRLAAWSLEEGLHMDTFHFPVACSCLVETEK
ncbi:uncharacterized protein LOC111249665 isoform X1 [Varroa destructor]|uniref:Spaetzle domain-containing protein n=1 Tax=Varroa destructor TaxID=109461 RepID=A0A7M7K2J3_VARDE|nr:uncharacterized protein LOC111249665 isoform X1 [Varroa destructor]